MAKKEKMLEDLFHETLKDIYYAEKKILTALPKMARAAQSEDLRAAFEKHERETRDRSAISRWKESMTPCVCMTGRLGSWSRRRLGAS